MSKRISNGIKRRGLPNLNKKNVLNVTYTTHLFCIINIYIIMHCDNIILDFKLFKIK